MSAISLKSITGITSITTPTGVDDQLTLHNNNTTERVKIDTAGNVHINNHLAIAGVATASTFVGALTGTASGNPTLTNGSNNRVVTATSSTGLNAEANLTYDGNSLFASGNITAASDGNRLTQGGVALVVRHSTNSAMRANHFIHDDFPSGSATYYIQATESGVTNDRNLALQGYGGKVKIGSGGVEPVETLDVSGNVKATSINLANSIFHTGDTDTLMSFSTDTIRFETAGSERLRIQGNGLVGIGTNNAGAPLHIQSDVAGLSIRRGGQYLQFDANFGNGGDQSISSSAGFRVQTGGVGNTYERVRITTGGQLLVGTTSANRNNKIHARLASGSIANNSTASVILAENSGNTWITIGSGASNYGGILFADSGSSDIGQVRYDHNNNALEFLTNGGNSSNIRLKIDSSGHLLPGANTSYDLGANVNNRWRNIYGQTLSLTSYATVASIVATDPGSSYYAYNNRIGNGLAIVGTTRMFGSVGVGTGSPVTNLDVRGSSDASITIGLNNGTKYGNFSCDNSATYLYAYNGNDIIFSTHSGNSFNRKVTLKNDGNFGINDASPSYKLNVIGDNTASNGIGMLKGIIGVQNDTTAYGSSPTAGISFQTKYRTGPDVPLDVAAIWGGKENTTNGDKDGYMGFATREEGGSGSQERMRITSDGKVVAGGNGTGYPSRLQSHGAGDLLDLNSTSGAGKIRFYESGAGRFNIETLNGAAGARFLDALNNVEAMRIHANGRITTPNQPMYSGIGYVGGGTQVQSSIYAIRPSAVYANLGSHFNTSTGVFTCPIAGRYLCIGAMGRRADAHQWNGFYLIQNGVTKGDMWFPPARNNGSNPALPAAFRSDQFTYNPTNLSAVLVCSANDTISFAFHNSYAAPLDSSGNYAQFILIG